jgi:hypothetical protein
MVVILVAAFVPLAAALLVPVKVVISFSLPQNMRK